MQLGWRTTEFSKSLGVFRPNNLSMLYARPHRGTIDALQIVFQRWFNNVKDDRIGSVANGVDILKLGFREGVT